MFEFRNVDERFGWYGQAHGRDVRVSSMARACAREPGRQVAGGVSALWSNAVGSSRYLSHVVDVGTKIWFGNMRRPLLREVVPWWFVCWTDVGSCRLSSSVYVDSGLYSKEGCRHGEVGQEQGEKKKESSGVDGGG